MATQDYNNLMMIGKRIKRLRESQELSIEDLAKRAEVNKNTIVRLEKGEKKVSLDTIIKVCEELNTSITKLFEGKPVEDIDYKMSEGPVTREIKYGLRKDRIIIEDGAVVIDDINIHLKGGSLHAGILEILGEGKKKSHRGEELLFCLTGKVEVDINGEKITLNKGDCVVFWGTEPHSYSYLASKKGKAICLSVLVGDKFEKLEDFLTH